MNLLKSSENNDVWNTNKEGGWQSYKELTENDFVLPETECNTVAMKKIEKEIERIKYNAFGKVKVKSLNKNITEVGNEELLKTQRKEVEFQFKRINDIRANKGNTAAVFDVLRIIKGTKKSGAEITAMKDPLTNELLLEPEKIKTAALEYCTNLLHNEHPDPDFALEIYTENLLHYSRSREFFENETSLKYSDLEARIHVIASKHRDKYKYLLNSGHCFLKFGTQKSNHSSGETQ